MIERRITTLMLGEPAGRGAESWIEFAPDASGATIVSERFAKRRLPAAALAAMREQPCFYMCVERIADALVNLPGRQIGAPHVAHGMREICVETAQGMVVIAEPAAARA